jgi:flavin-binding protein dodecin
LAEIDGRNPDQVTRDDMERALEELQRLAARGGGQLDVAEGEDARDSSDPSAGHAERKPKYVGDDESQYGRNSPCKGSRRPSTNRCSGPAARVATRRAPERTPELMEGHVYKKVELTGASAQSVEGAVKAAIAKAGESLRNLRWFEIVETRGAITNGEVSEWQVTVKVCFTVE